LAQTELSSRSGVRQPNIAAYENGTRTPSEAMVRRLLDAARLRPSDALDLHREEVLALAAEHHATDVRVFGSVARGDDTLESDLDLLVEFLPGASVLDLWGLESELSELLGCPVDVVSEAGVKGKRLERRIARDAVSL
jgi:predicted nucleotidyltransferase